MYEREQEEAIQFLSLSKEERLEHWGFYTQEDLAIHLGLPHTNLISKWKANPKFTRKLENSLKSGFRDLIPAAKRRLAERGIEDGDVTALNSILKNAGFTVDRVESITDSDIHFVIQTVIEITNEVLEKHPDLLTSFQTKLEEKLGDL